MTIKISVIRLRLQVDETIAFQLDGQSKICNWLYNKLLEQANELKNKYIETKDNKISKTLYSQYGIRNLVPELKKIHKFLNVVHSSPLKNTALRLSKSIKAYQSKKEIPQKNKYGWPKFRSWRSKWFSLLYDEPKKGFKLVDNILHISLGRANNENKLLQIPIKNSQLLKNITIRNCQICKDGNEYFAIFNVEKKYPEQKQISKIIAFDPNHKNLLYGVDNLGNAIEVKGLDWLKKYDLRIDELKSKRDRCQKKARLIDSIDHKSNSTWNKRWKPSKRWVKYNKVLDDVYRKRREHIKIFCYTLSNQLCKNYDLICIGDYTPHGGGITKKMRRAMNNRSVIGRFKQTLSWVAFKSGKSYQEYPEYGTTKTCHNCKTKVSDGLSPKIRYWQCAICNWQHIRDENAAINGLLKIYTQLLDDTLLDAKDHANSLASVPSSGPVIAVQKRWAWSVLPRGINSILRGQGRGLAANSKKLNKQYGNCLPIFGFAH
jgi:putative transposase